MARKTTKTTTPSTKPVDIAVDPRDGSVAIPAPVAATAAPAKPAAKKAPAAKPTAVKKGTPAPAAREPRAKKEGLRKAQVRILAALSKSKKALTRKEISEKAPCDVANCVELIGSHKDDVRKANDVKHYPSLLTLKFVKFGQPGEDNVPVYEITAAGKTALAAAAE